MNIANAPTEKTKILILGESNSVYSDGWVKGFEQALGDPFIVKNRSLGSSGIFNTLFNLHQLGSALTDFDAVILDTSIQDIVFFKTQFNRYFHLLDEVLAYLAQCSISLSYVQFESLHQTELEAKFSDAIARYYDEKRIPFYSVAKILQSKNATVTPFELAKFYSDPHHVERSVAFQIGQSIAQHFKKTQIKKPAIDPTHVPVSAFDFIDAQTLAKWSTATDIKSTSINTKIIATEQIEIRHQSHSIPIPIPDSYLGKEIIGLAFNAPHSNGVLEINNGKARRKNFSNSMWQQWRADLVWCRPFHQPISLNHTLRLSASDDSMDAEASEYCQAQDYRAELPASIKLIGFFLMNSTKANETTQIDRKQAMRDLAKLFNESQYQQAAQLAQTACIGFPDDAFFWKVLGAAQIQMGENQAALLNLKKALKISEIDPETHNNLAANLNNLARHEEAEQHFQRAIQLKPNYAAAYANYGDMLMKMNRYAQAEKLYAAALQNDPALIATRNRRAIALHHLKRLEEALEIFSEILTENPQSAEAHCNRANTLKQLDRANEAEKNYRTAIRLSPRFLDAYSNLGELLSQNSRYADALEQCQIALSLDSKHPAAQNNCAVALHGLGRYTEAVLVLRKLLTSHPNHMEARVNLAHTLFALAQFDEAWTLNEARYHPDNQTRNISAPRLDFPQWQGENLHSKTILIMLEQGIGDQIQFIRYIEHLRSFGAKQIFIQCNAATRHLFSCLESNLITLVEKVQDLRQVDYWIFLLSIAFHCKTRLENIPANIPYLGTTPKQPLYIQFKTALSAINELKIGLCWSGSKKYRHDAERSIALTIFESLNQVSGIKLFCLQAQGREAFLRQFPNIAYDLKHEIDCDTLAFEESTALIAHLDIVIACDTSIAHLAGAMGKPVFLLLPFVADWRWMTQRDDSPWYPNTRLFRQDQTARWEPVFQRVLLAIEALKKAKNTVAPHLNLNEHSQLSSIAIPSSLGDLLDRISILKIKSEKINDPIKLQNIIRELNFLEEHPASKQKKEPPFSTLYDQLKEINENIWEVEDSIRLKEKAAQFDQNFIALARAVYIQNDQRASIKKQINLLGNSVLIEEKSYPSLSI